MEKETEIKEVKTKEAVAEKKQVKKTVPEEFKIRYNYAELEVLELSKDNIDFLHTFSDVEYFRVHPKKRYVVAKLKEKKGPENTNVIVIDVEKMLVAPCKDMRTAIKEVIEIA